MRLRILVVASLAPLSVARGQGASVSGVVGDSIARGPLRNARVQLVGADDPQFSRTATSDGQGRFTIAGLPDGRYVLGFFHPLLDSIGVQPPPRVVQVTGGREVQADLSIPAPARIRAAICGPWSAADSSLMPPGVLVGTVRDARTHQPLDSVSVTGEWLEMSLRQDGVVRRVPRFTAHTGDNGWFAICNVPSGGTMFLSAVRGADSTAVIELPVPSAGFARRELYLGEARTIVTGDTTRMNDTSAAPVRRLRVGDGRIGGVVLAGAEARPLANARVAIADGPEVRTNDLGEWTITNAPAGTRMLEVRAVGYSPRREPVNVVADAPPVRTTLATLKAMMDTIRVVARRPTFDRDSYGFERRRHMGMGRFLTPDQIERRNPVYTSDLFMNFPGVRVNRNATEESILMRGPFGLCAPVVWVDGMNFSNMGTGDLDAFVNPRYIRGIEVYNDLQVPPQYKDLTRMDGCGSIVIWTN